MSKTSRRDSVALKASFFQCLQDGYVLQHRTSNGVGRLRNCLREIGLGAGIAHHLHRPPIGLGGYKMGVQYRTLASAARTRKFKPPGHITGPFRFGRHLGHGGNERPSAPQQRVIEGQPTRYGALPDGSLFFVHFESVCTRTVRWEPKSCQCRVSARSEGTDSAVKT